MGLRSSFGKMGKNVFFYAVVYTGSLIGVFALTLYRYSVITEEMGLGNLSWPNLVEVALLYGVLVSLPLLFLKFGSKINRKLSVILSAIVFAVIFAMFLFSTIAAKTFVETIKDKMEWLLVLYFVVTSFYSIPEVWQFAGGYKEK